MTKREIMVRAWEIARELVGDLSARLSMAMKQAWEESKNQQKEFNAVEINGHVFQLSSYEAFKLNKVLKGDEFIASARITSRSITLSNNVCFGSGDSYTTYNEEFLKIKSNEFFKELGKGFFYSVKALAI